MNISAPFINRPIATTLLTLAILAAGAIAFFQLPVASLPEVDFPTISVQAQLPGADPETVATSLASPLERHLGQIADVTEMTSASSVGQTRITLQFGLNRNIDGAARDVEASLQEQLLDAFHELVIAPAGANPKPCRALLAGILADSSKRRAERLKRLESEDFDQDEALAIEVSTTSQDCVTFILEH